MRPSSWSAEAAIPGGAGATTPRIRCRSPARSCGRSGRPGQPASRSTRSASAGAFAAGSTSLPSRAHTRLASSGSTSGRHPRTRLASPPARPAVVGDRTRAHPYQGHRSLARRRRGHRPARGAAVCHRLLGSGQGRAQGRHAASAGTLTRRCRCAPARVLCSSGPRARHRGLLPRRGSQDASQATGDTGAVG